MSWMPEGFEAELTATITAVKLNKTKQKIEANKLSTDEWKAQLLQWLTHYKKQKQLPYAQRTPYYQDAENRIVIMAFQSKAEEPRKTNISEKKPISIYYDFFVSGLLSNLLTEPKVSKEVTIYDTDANSVFEAWYLKQGQWVSGKRFLRGQLSIKYKDLGDDKDKYGSLPWVYAKRKGYEEIEDVPHTLYERLFTLNLWESIPFPR